MWQHLGMRQLFQNNLRWANQIKNTDPLFFEKSARRHQPEFLWIGCADSRVPANEIVGLGPGELFVHRNLANLVIESDPNCMSVIQYAIDVLKVKHVIVCGHYGCAGVAAAINGGPDELIDNWLVHIKDLYDRNHPMLADCVDEEQRVDRLCEINVTAQVSNVCHSKIVQAAWQRGQDLKVHGWIYNMTDGLLKDLNITVDTPGGAPEL